jgi:predicted dehydrogenase
MILPSWAQSPNEKLDVAVTGVAGRGAANLKGVQGENVVALCDVDRNKLEAAAKNFPKAQTFRDFRRMFDALEGKIDAAVVSTPDHTHAPAGVRALTMGKHLYCEKPLTRCVFETRTMTDLAVEKKLTTQLGTQIHAESNYRRVVELIRSGAIGTVQEVHVWCGAQYAPGDRPADRPPVPENLDWDLWLGPAPYRPYHPAYVPGKWRGWWDFATGGLGDFFCHYSDLAFWALDLRYPTTVEAEGPPVHPESCHAWMIVRYEFPARGDLPPVKLTWYDGGKRPPMVGQNGIPDWKNGQLFIGSKGMLLSDYGNRKLLPESQFADFQPPQPTIPDSIGHHAEWIKACKTGEPTTCNFAYSGPLTEAALLGAVSYRTGRKLEWDPVNLKAANCPEADVLIHRPYRQGWTL